MFHKSLFKCIKSKSSGDGSFLEITNYQDQQSMQNRLSSSNEEFNGKMHLFNSELSKKIRNLIKKTKSASNETKSKTLKHRRKSKSNRKLDKNSNSLFSQDSNILSSTTILSSEYMYQQYLEASCIRNDFYSGDSDFSDEDLSDESQDNSIIDTQDMKDLDLDPIHANELSFSSLKSFELFYVETYKPIDKLQSFNSADLNEFSKNLMSSPSQSNILSSTCNCRENKSSEKRFAPMQTSSRKSLLIESDTILNESVISSSSSESSESLILLSQTSDSDEIPYVDFNQTNLESTIVFNDIKSSTFVSTFSLINSNKFCPDKSAVCNIFREANL